MLSRSPAARMGIVAGGLVLSLAAAWVAVGIRQRLTLGPEAQASAGMYAFGDMVLGVFVFGLLALVPLGLALCWLRGHAPFWIFLAWAGGMFALTGPPAILVSGWLRGAAGNWAILSDARFGLMPLSALAMLTCGLFAPQPKPRWILISAAALDGGIFLGVVLVKFVLPELAR